MTTHKLLTFGQARAVAEAAASASVRLGVPVNIAVVDAGAHPLYFARLDGAALGSADLAQRKARTSALFGLDTGAIGAFSAPGGPAPGIEISNGGLITFPGGCPIRMDGILAGAIGVSGGTVEQDHLIASAGLDALTSNPRE